jgi:alkyl hydroperoxide reductase subunit AhpC
MTKMLTVGDEFPALKLKAVVSTELGQELGDVTARSDAGEWLVLFSWPMHCGFVCPIEIAEFARWDREKIKRR